MHDSSLTHLLNKEVQSHKEEVIRVRKELHKIPELAFEEHRTTMFIDSYFKNLKNFKVYRVTKTGVIAELDSGREGKVLAIRADMDGLPVKEETGVNYASQISGQMHACGHDGHMAALLVAAKIIDKHANLISGKVRLLFQPAEEIGEGASVYVEKGVLRDVDALTGVHIWSPLDNGIIGINGGALMAAGDFFEVEISGKGGHAAMPNETIDTAVIAANLVLAFQTIVSRSLPPTTTGVVSVTKIDCGNSYNIIPERLVLGGTLRSLSLSGMETIYDKIESLSLNIARTYGGKAVVDFTSRPNAYPLVNDLELANKIKSNLLEVFTKEECKEVTPTLAGDDFSQYLKTGVPGCYIFVGCGGEGTNYPHHHPKFNITDESIVNALKVHLQTIKSINMEG